MDKTSIGAGYLLPTTNTGEYNQTYTIFDQMLSDVQTAALVKVVSCSNSGGISQVGTVDVTPMVSLVDSQGNIYPHGTIFSVPYCRIQGGTSAVILDPSAGDIGVCVFASRDISVVKETKKESPPGSRRKFSYSDALYIGGFLNAAPSQYVRFSSDGVEICAANITLKGNVIIQGNTTSSGSMVVSGVNFSSHVHTGVQSGDNNTGGPI